MLLKRLFIAVLLVVVLMVINNYLTEQWLKRASLSVLEGPLSGSFQWLGELKVTVTSWFRVADIIKENRTLEEANRVLRAENLKIQELAKENDFLREELGVAKKRGYELEMARVFNFNTDGPFRTALIDKGAREGLQPGQAVIFGGDVLLGLIKETYPAQSLIYLLNDPRVALNAKIVDTAVSGRTRGALEQGLFLELITNQEEIIEGQLAVTSGLDGLPSSLIIGQVANVRVKSGELFKTVKINPEFGDVLLDNVFVLKNH